MSHGKGDAKRVVLAALAGNLAIAVCKFAAAYLSQSTATLAEAVHSVADSANQLLLLLGIALAAKGPSSLFPFGRASERYFWPFVVALMLFSVGGAFGIYEGVHKLGDASQEGASPIYSIVVLVLSILFESGSCYVAVREFNKQRGTKPFAEAIMTDKDPTIGLVVMEDLAAIAGLVIALVAVSLSALTHNAVFDSIGSIVIGLLLCLTAVVIAVRTHRLLIGEGASLPMQQRAYELASGTAGVLSITQFLTLHLGPDDVVLAMKVAFPPTMPAADIEAVTNTVEARIRTEIPEFRRIFVEADSMGDGRGVPR